jgi:HJR/Mrr/RecB family endonuclease
MLNGSGDVGPGDFGLADVVPDADGKEFFATITLDDVLQMQWDYFECMIAVIWRKKGYKIVYRTPQQDDGVDVVAISGSTGVLLQCKTSSSDKSSLGWDAVKDVVAGEAAYRRRHPGVDFQRVCITNQSFNNTAKTHADLNNVELLNKSDICAILKDTPITMHDIESLLHVTWG